MKKLGFLFSVLLPVALGFVMTSCSKENEPTGDIIYNAGVTAFEGEYVFGELTEINNIYFSALNVNDEYFTLHGNAKDCDAKVLKACESAQKVIESKEWSANFTYTVTQLNNEKVVYKYSYKKK